MKTKLLFIISLGLLLISCKSPLADINKNNNSELVSVSFDIGLTNTQNPRKVIPNYTTEDGKPFYTVFTYELIVTDTNDKNNNFIVNNKKYDELTSLESELYINHTYNFEVNAYNNENTKVLSGTKNNVTISKTENEISISLDSIPTVNGNFEFSLLNLDYDLNNSNLLPFIYELSDFLTNNTNAKNLANIQKSNIDLENYIYSYSDSLVPGNYYFTLVLTSTDANGGNESYVLFSDQITIFSTLTTKKTEKFCNKSPVIYLDLNGGQFNFESEDFKNFLNDGNSIIKLNNIYQLFGDSSFIFENSYYPTKPGYLFAGWYLESSPLINDQQIMSHYGNLNLYAKWYKPLTTLDMSLAFMTTSGLYKTNNYSNINKEAPLSNYCYNNPYATSPDNSIIYYIPNNDSITESKSNTTVFTLPDKPTYVDEYSYYEICSIINPSENQLFVLTDSYKNNSDNKYYCNLYIQNLQTLQSQPSLFKIQITTQESIYNLHMAIDYANKYIYLLYTSSEEMTISKYKYDEINTEIEFDSSTSFKFYTLPAKTKPTDFVFSNNTLYLTTSCIGGAEKDYLNLFGNVYEVQDNNGTFILNPILNEFDTSKTSFINNNLKYYASTDKYSEKILFGPEKILAITPKKLVLADSGVFIYTNDDYYNMADVNRIVEIDLESKIIDYIQEIPIQFKESPINSELSCF